MWPLQLEPLRPATRWQPEFDGINLIVQLDIYLIFIVRNVFTVWQWCGNWELFYSVSRSDPMVNVESVMTLVSLMCAMSLFSMMTVTSVMAVNVRDVLNVHDGLNDSDFCASYDVFNASKTLLNTENDIKASILSIFMQF